jgi:hypothetical protein
VICDSRDVTREKQVRGGQRRMKWVRGRKCRRADKLIRTLTQPNRYSTILSCFCVSRGNKGLRNQTCRSAVEVKEECEIRSQFLVSPRASANLIEIGATLLMTVWQTPTRLSTNSTKCCKRWAVSQVPVAAAKSWLRVREGFRWAASHFLHAVTNAVEIVRVLHGGRDIESIFEGHAKHSDPGSCCE